MMAKSVGTSALAVAMFAAIAGAVVRAPDTRVPITRGFDLTRQSAAKQLPDGLMLPSSDVNLDVASLVAADLDADGDLDIVAADTSAGSLGIVVWVNDGAGHLTRERPADGRSLATEPASPSIEHRQGTVPASTQPNTPAVDAPAVSVRYALPARPWNLPATPDARSALLSALPSRSPPVRS